MDEGLQYLFNLLPASWQPYVVLLLIVAYVVTKYRSEMKTKLLNVHHYNPGTEGFERKDLGMIQPQGIFKKVVNFLF